MDPFSQNDGKADQEDLQGQEARTPETPPPDPSKPLPGETYSDYMRRLDQEQKAREQQQNYSDQEYWSGLRDYGHATSGDPNYGPIPEEYRMNGMSKAAFFCGLLSLFTIFFGFSWFFGALGILFALLSRRKKLGRQARIALWMSGIGLGAFLIAVVSSVSLLVRLGIWDSMMQKIDHLDPNDPAAVLEMREELLDELLRKYNVGY